MRNKKDKEKHILRKKWRNNFTNFHETTLPSFLENRFLLVLIIGYIVGEYITFNLYDLGYDWLDNWIEEIVFALTEIIPLFIGLGYVYLKRENLHIRSLFKSIGTQLKRWTKFLLHDLRKHIFFILVLAFLIYLAMIVARIVVGLFFTQDLNQGVSGNTQLWKKDIFQNLFTVVCPVIIAPIFEEIFFRKLLTNCLVRFFNNRFFTFKGSFKMRYIISSILSSILFASFHDGVGDIPIVASYMACALVLQYVHYRSKSVTAPILAHMTYNLITFLLIL